MQLLSVVVLDRGHGRGTDVPRVVEVANDVPSHSKTKPTTVRQLSRCLPSPVRKLGTYPTDLCPPVVSGVPLGAVCRDEVGVRGRARQGHYSQCRSLSVLTLSQSSSGQ